MRGEKIHTLSDLLAKYKKLQAPQGAVVAVCVAAAREVLGVEVPASALKYDTRTRTMHITLSGPLKQELRMKASQVLAVCARELGDAQTPRALV